MPVVKPARYRVQLPRRGALRVAVAVLLLASSCAGTTIETRSAVRAGVADEEQVANESVGEGADTEASASGSAAPSLEVAPAPVATAVPAEAPTAESTPPPSATAVAAPASPTPASPTPGPAPGDAAAPSPGASESTATTTPVPAATTVVPTATPEPTATATPEPSATATPVPTASPTPTPTLSYVETVPDDDESTVGNTEVAPDDGDSRANPQRPEDDGFLIGSVSAPVGDPIDWSSFSVAPEDPTDVFLGVLCENYSSADGSGVVTLTVYQAEDAVAVMRCTADSLEDFTELQLVVGATYFVSAEISGSGYADWFLQAGDDD